MTILSTVFLKFQCKKVRIILDCSECNLCKKLIFCACLEPEDPSENNDVEDEFEDDDANDRFEFSESNEKGKSLADMKQEDFPSF